MNLERVVCPICGVDDTETLFTKGDLTAEITNVVCRRCGLVYINPRPTASEYESFHIESFLKERHGVGDPQDVAHKIDGNDLRMKSAVLEFIRPELRSGVRVLDVGCGFGTLLHLIKKEIPEAKVEGIELARVDVEAAKRFYDLDLFEGSLAKYADTRSDARFDLVILHHTFEHFPEPRVELRRIKGLLAPGGAVYIGLPDIMDFRKRPEIFFQLGHPYSYSPASLRKMLAAEGLAVVIWNSDAAFPGGMELLAESVPPTRREVPSESMSAGKNAGDVIRSVRSAERRFAQMRGIRDRLLFFLPPRLRVAVTRPFYQLMKRGIGSRGWIVVVAAAAVLTSVLFNLTNFLLAWGTWRSGAQYTYFTFLNPDAMANLAPMIRDVLDGHWFPSDGRLAEHVSDPNLWSTINPLLFAPFIFFTKSVPTALLLGRFVIVALTYPVFYLLAYRITCRRAVAAWSSAVFLIAPLLWYHLPPTSIESVSTLVRTFFPLGSLPGEILLSKYNSYSIFPALLFTIGGLAGILIALETLDRRWAMAFGALTGLLATMYVTNAIYLVAIWVIAASLLMFQRRRGVMPLLAWSAVAAAVTATPFLWNYIHINSLPHADEFYRRLGGDLTHAFRWSEWREYALYTLFAAAVFWLGMRRGRPALGAFLAGCVLSAIAVLNLQVFIGYNPAPTAWKIHQLFFGFSLAWLALFTSAYEWTQKQVRRGRFLAPGIALLVAVMIIGRAVSAEVYAARYTNGFTDLPAFYRDAFVWLDSNTPSDSVVVTPSLASNSLIPFLTHNRVLIGKAVTSPASSDELVDRLLVSYALFNISERYLEQGLTKSNPLIDPFARNAENGIVTWLFEYQFVGGGLNEFYAGGSRDVPEDVVRDILSRYSRYPRRPGYLLSHYEVDYLFVGPIERQIMRADFDSVPYLEKVYDANDVRIYAVNHGVAKAL